MADKLGEIIERLQRTMGNVVASTRPEDLAAAGFTQASASSPSIDALWKLLVAKGVISQREANDALTDAYTAKNSMMGGDNSLIVPRH